MKEEEYEKLLDNVYANLPKKIKEDVRFDIPTFQIVSEGNKTIIKNFVQVCETMRRDKKIVIKYLSKELATPINIDGGRAILQRKLNGQLINKKLKEFFEKYVVCKECHRPDTRMIDLGHGILQIICEACGAKYTTRI